MTTWRLAWASAYDTSAGDGRLRLVATLLACLAATFGLLLAFATIHAADRAEMRDEARMGRLSAGGGSNDVLTQRTTLRWGEHTITLVALEKVGSDPALPPGLHELPPSGSAWVSPGLAKILEHDEALAESLSVVGVINDEGVTDSGELLAFVGVSDGTLSAPGDPFMESMGEYSGKGPMILVSSFGHGPGLPVVAVSGKELAGGMELWSFVAVLVLSAIVLIVVSLGLASPSRNRRLALLEALGVGVGRRARVLAAEATLLVGPPVLVTSVIWQVVSPRMESLPLVGRAINSGDATLPWPWVVVAVGCMIVVAAGTGALLALGKSVGAAVRPIPARERVWGVGWLVLGASMWIMLTALSKGGEMDAGLYLLGSGLAIVGVPLAAPSLLRLLGRIFRRSSSVSLAVAGAAMDRDPLRAGRPFTGLLAMIVLTAVASGYLVLARYVEGSAASSTGTHAMLVEWRGVDSDAELTALQQRLPDQVLLPVLDSHSEHSHESEAVGPSVAVETHAHDVVIAADCDTLKQSLLRARCDSDGVVAGDVAAAVRRLGLSEDGGAVRFDPTVNYSNDGRAQVLLLGQGNLQEVGDELRLAALETLPFSRVTTASDADPRPSSLVGWIEDALLVGVILLVLASLIALVDRFRRTSFDQQFLTRIGVGRPAIGRLRAGVFSVPYVSGGLLALLVGALTASTVSNAVEAPWAALGYLGVAVLAVGVAGALVVAIPVERRQRED